MEQGVRVAYGTGNIVCFVVWLQQIVIIAGDWVNWNEIARVQVVDSKGKVSAFIWGGGLIEFHRIELTPVVYIYIYIDYSVKHAKYRTYGKLEKGNYKAA
jgi:hypothetical protein